MAGREPRGKSADEFRPPSDQSRRTASDVSLSDENVKSTTTMPETKVLIPDARLTFEVNGNEECERVDGLSKLATTVAERELNETPSAREQALATLRGWVSKHPQLFEVRLDNNFLLRFLRARKFNVPMAEHNLVKYINFRQSIRDFSFDLDYREGKVARLIDEGYIFASPFRDSHGRRVVIAVAEKLDPARYTKVEMAKAHLITYETLLEDEENQVLGLTHFADIKALSMSQVAMWPPLEMAICLRIGEQALPLRHKAIHVINYTAPFKFCVDFASSRVSQKMRDRLTLHNSLNDLHKNLDRRCLPKEYGGDVPMADMIAMWKKELEASRSRLLTLDRMKSLVPIKRRSSPEELAGSFRKLEVD